MKSGRVVTIRVNARDCMGCIDVVQKVALITKGMSYAQIVSIALNSLLNTVREAGAIPEREGFEYNEMMQPWSIPTAHKRKLSITHEVEILGSEMRVPAVPLHRAEVNEFEARIAANPQIRRLETRQRELAALQQADPANDRTEEILEVANQLTQLYKAEQP